MLKNAPACAEASAGRQMQVELIMQQNLPCENRDGRFSASVEGLTWDSSITSHAFITFQPINFLL
jgi:hypothetical protein